MKLNNASIALVATTASIILTTNHAFTVTSTTKTSTSSILNTSSSSSSSNEGILRDELKQKSTLVNAEDEIKYGTGGDSGLTTTSSTTYTDGLITSTTDAFDSESTTTTTTTRSITTNNDQQSSSSSSSSSTTTTMDKMKLQRILKPRAYPLFLAEKSAMILEDIFNTDDSTTTTDKKLSAYEIYQQKQNGITKEKEKIVILGTGWGSAAFLKDIDTNMYDVTVISPRNFFLFTPMLAGASVGTVEYRSITESVREVSVKKREEFYDSNIIIIIIIIRIFMENLFLYFLS